jgi:hypothetical protein
MKVDGNRRVVLAEPRDEMPHAWPGDPNWQESVVIFMWDVAQKCFVYLRIGHEPGYAGGTVVVWCNVWVPGKYFKRYEDLPLRAEDKLVNGFCGGAISRYTYDGKHNWTVDDSQVSLQLAMEDIHPAFDFFPQQNNMGEIAASHFEATGRVNGTIRFQGSTYTIRNAVGYRDHSWGVRIWEGMRAYRWLPAIFGDDFIAQPISMIGPDRTLHQLGYLYRDDTVIIPKQTSILTFMEADGMSSRGGIATFTLDSGEKLDIHYTNIVPGAMNRHRGLPCSETMATVRCGDRTGVGAYTIAENTMSGTELPSQNMLLGVYIENGVFPYEYGCSRIGPR